MNDHEIVCADLNRAIDDLRREGYRLEIIYPADDPQAAVLRRSEERVLLATPDAPLLPAGLPDFVPQFVLTRASEPPGQGRAGMLYRDLIPGRLGGRYIASHITIPVGGPVDDWVHYHRIALQMIFVRSGWVRVVYEDQSEPFVMNEGDLVLQPPGIRHRVLESSPGLEVVEISAPALHETFADHELSLPNGERQERSFGNQRFLRHVAAQSAWTQSNGAEVQQTAMLDATGGLADVRVLRAGSASQIRFAPHDGELVFGFVLDGTSSLSGEQIASADAFVMPPGEPWSLDALSPDFCLLHVTTVRLDDAG